MQYPTEALRHDLHRTATSCHLIADVHALRAFESKVLMVLAAPALSEEVARVYGALDDDAVTTPARIARCLGIDAGAPELRAALDPQGPLTRCGLIVQDLTRRWSQRGVSLHPRILARLRRG